MIKIKDKQAISKMRIAGHRLAEIFNNLASVVEKGVSTAEIDSFIETSMREKGLVPVCKGYAGYKHASCISVNDVVVHGVPSEKEVLKNGDLVKIDVVGSYKGYCADMARCFFVGQPQPVAQRLVDVAQYALDAAIKHAQPGVCLSDISATIQQKVEEQGFGVVRSFAGHGIGKSMHEDPEVPNFGEPGRGPRLRPGMVLAIEPMITQGHFAVKIMADGWTARTCDGGLAGHVEDTVAITEDGPEILTRIS